MANSKKPSLKAETLKMTGWTEAEYRRRYGITCMARVGLLLTIRETCPNPSQDFIYCDTDSIHVFTECPNPDAGEHELLLQGE